MTRSEVARFLISEEIKYYSLKPHESREELLDKIMVIVNMHARESVIEALNTAVKTTIESLRR